MNFREMTQSDIEFMKDNSISRGIFHKQPKVVEYCYALEHEGKLLGVGGFRLINLTTAWVWFDLTHYSGGHIIKVYRVLKEWLDIFVEQHGLKRVQAYIDPDFPEAIRTAKHLGFKFESVMENFIGDRDAWMYTRFTE